MPTPRRGRRRLATMFASATFLMAILPVMPAAANNTVQSLPFSQNWTDISMITVDGDWASVPGIIGYRGDDLTTVTGTDPQTLLADGAGTPVNVEANETNPTGFATGGVAEFHITDPVIALNGSGTADAPHIVLHLATTGLTNIGVSYNLRDLDASIDNAVQPIALQFRVGATGPYTNVPGGFVADASGGPSTATLVTPVSVVLPAEANNQALVNVRIITANAGGNDEWVGIDDISVIGSAADVAPSVQSTLPANGASNVPVDSSITVTFSEPITPSSDAFSLVCASGPKTVAVSGGPSVWTVDPDGLLANSDSCTLTIMADRISDDDSLDPPDKMAADFTATFTTAPAGPAAGDVVISEVYGGGGNAGATFTNDFIELYNRTAAPISLAGWSVQYGSSTGTTWQVTPLTGSIAAGRYYLVQEAQGAGGTTPLPTPDATGTIPMSGTAGKVALVSSTTALSGSCPTGAPIIDLVGYGAANCSETSPTPALTNTTSAQRKSGGATDTNNNLNDFDIGAPDPRAAEKAPSVASTNPANGASSVALAANISITFSEPVNVTGFWFTISCVSSGAHTALASGGPVTFDLDPDANFAVNESCTVTIVAANVTDQDTDDPPENMAANHVFSFTSLDVFTCGDPATPIHDVQGNGLASPIVGSVVNIEGVVVGDFQGPGQFNGFYLQEETADADADVLTSEGIFVFGASLADVSIGDVVRARGTVTEFITGTGTLTELTNVGPMAVCSQGNTVPAASAVFLPVNAATDLERFEGMHVVLPQSLVIAEYFNFERFGELVLAKPLVGETRPFTPTAIDAPGAPAQARALANSLSRITLDDGLGIQNPEFLRHPNGLAVSTSNLFRGGDTVAATTGVLTFDFSLYRIQPTIAATYTSVNPRPAAPEPVGGSLRVAAMNTLNFFVTLDTTTSDTGPGPCGGNANLDCRGADSDQPFEFTRQRDKLLAALAGLNSDVIGLNELENTPNVEPLASIVSGLPGYDYINTGTIGTDAIKVGLIYRPAVVTPVGAFEVLDSTDDPRFIDTRSRPALAQTFKLNATGARFTVVVNHLKSKGSACTGDPDTGDGQGNCNQTRTLAAQALVDWIATDPTGSGDPDFLIMGDLNSYAKEDPITAILAGSDDASGTGDDYTNLIAQFQGTYAYSYTFDGQAGYLDHALASASILSQVTGAVDWHINSDEPDVVDYDTTFKGPNQEALYEVNAYRASDHDPVIVGLNLTNAAPLVDAGGPYAVDEGGSVGVSATGSDPEGGSVTFAWDLDDNGSFETPGQNATFSAATIDGPAIRTIKVQATDMGGVSTVDSATVNVGDVPPTATFESPPTVLAGFDFTLSLTNPNDPSAADIAAGFSYAFDCGSGYGAFGSANSATCTTSTSGQLDVGGIIRDKDGDATEYRGVVVVEPSARSTIEDVQAQVNALIVGAAKHDANKLKEAANALNKALDPRLWIDPMHVTSKDGHKVFDRLKDAVQPLKDVLKRGVIPTATTQALIDDLVGAAAMLARTAIDDAIAAGAPADKVDKALTEFAKGDTDAAKGDAVNAIEHYKKAWQRALDAMK